MRLICYHGDSFIDDDVTNDCVGEEEGGGVPPPVHGAHLHTETLHHNHRLWKKWRRTGRENQLLLPFGTQNRNDVAFSALQVYFAHSHPKYTPQLLPLGSGAMIHVLY